MAQQAIAAEQVEPLADGRGLNRTNLFIAAVLHSAQGGAVAVKIRNLSPTGAMIEGAALPPAGSLVRLVRGSLGMAATVMWNSAVRCGIAFDGTVSVKDWMSPPANGEQQRVDDRFSRLRSDKSFLAMPSPPPVREPLSVPAELAVIAQLVEQLGEALAGDEAVVARHGVSLQKIDIVLQYLEATASAAAGRIGSGARLLDLRASAEQALRA